MCLFFQCFLSAYMQEAQENEPSFSSVPTLREAHGGKECVPLDMGGTEPRLQGSIRAGDLSIRIF